MWKYFHITSPTTVQKSSTESSVESIHVEIFQQNNPHPGLILQAWWCLVSSGKYEAVAEVGGARGDAHATGPVAADPLRVDRVRGAAGLEEVTGPPGKMASALREKLLMFG
jgi:hypothetical protein